MAESTNTPQPIIELKDVSFTYASAASDGT